MAFITVFDEAPISVSAGWSELEFYSEDTAEGAMLTVVGRYDDITRWLAEVWAVDDAAGQAFLIGQILPTYAMDEHNAAASAIGI